MGTEMTEHETTEIQQELARISEYAITLAKKIAALGTLLEITFKPE